MNNLRYADVVVLIAGSMQELQELVNRVVWKSEKAGLFLNVDKTKVMKIETDFPSDENIFINGETVIEINHYNYLGATIITSYDDSKEIRKRISIAKNAVVALSHTWKNKSISLKTKKRLLNALVFPVATYGSEEVTNFSTVQVYRMAQDRREWRQFIMDASAHHANDLSV